MLLLFQEKTIINKEAIVFFSLGLFIVCIIDWLNLFRLLGLR